MNIKKINIDVKIADIACSDDAKDSSVSNFFFLKKTCKYFSVLSITSLNHIAPFIDLAYLN